MSEDGTPLSPKERAKALRREAYLRAKERYAPFLKEQRERAKLARREAYQKYRENAKSKEKDDRVIQEDLMSLVTTADKLPARPHLRIVKPGED